MGEPLRFRRATTDDVATVVALVNRAYRGDESKKGWTTEADLLEGIRTDVDEVAELVAGPETVILLCERDGAVVGTVLLERGEDAGYLGMLVIDPLLQAGGLGKELMRAAESFVREEWGLSRIWMTVLRQRTELIEFYERRGYRHTGDVHPWTDNARSRPRVEGLVFWVLEKHL